MKNKALVPRHNLVTAVSWWPVIMSVIIHKQTKKKKIENAHALLVNQMVSVR